MRTFLSNPARPAYYTVREAASILCVDRSSVSRAIRVGTLHAVRRRGRLVVPAAALARLLGEPTDGDPPPGGMP
ncbi:MAG: helix-turn-helix domain-containing protein [Pseudonocardiaceae bacterium]|nr:helix-turn-helix domain-containing protein [Pseudonocardiaceae bacterium]